MNDLKQIRIIEKALNKEKEHYFFELSRLNGSVEKKKLLIKKITSYLQEYQNENQLIISKSIPLLHKNLDLFINQMRGVIAQTEREIEHLKQNQLFLMKKIQMVEQKIKLMAHFEEKVLCKLKKRSEKIEQTAIDDMAIMQKQRSLYD